MTWEVVLNESLVPAEGLLAVDFLDEINGIAVGPGPKILRTTDGGLNWVQEFIPYDVNTDFGLSFVAYPAVDTAIAVFGAELAIKYSGEQTLLAPSFLRPTGNDLQQVDEVRIEWTAIEGATQYQVQVGLKPIERQSQYDRAIYTDALVDEIVDGTSITLNDLNYHHCYYVRVRALNEQETSDWREFRKGCLFLTVQSDPPLTIPAITQPAAMSNSVQPKDVVISWEAVPGEVTYDLQVAGSDPQFLIRDEFYVNETGLEVPTYTVSELPVGELLYIRVRARTNRNASDWSSENDVHWFQVDPASSVAERGPGTWDVQLTISPQPAGDVLHVALNGWKPNRDLDVKLFDLMGHVVVDNRTAREPKLHFDMNLQGLPQGMYFLVLSQGGVSITRPVHVRR